VHGDRFIVLGKKAKDGKAGLFIGRNSMGWDGKGLKRMRCKKPNINVRNVHEPIDCMFIIKFQCVVSLIKKTLMFITI
jgi:hypothetical protein